MLSDEERLSQLHIKETAWEHLRSGDQARAKTLSTRYEDVRQLSIDLVEQLSDADASAQSMPDASPAKWHLAHSTWFFETFILRDHVAGFRLHDERWPYLFNSYYEAEGDRHARPLRGLLTRPSLAEVVQYRHRTDEAMRAIIPKMLERIPDLIELGLQHEQQHQELLLTDLQHLFFCNPLGPAAWPSGNVERPHAEDASDLHWHPGPQGVTAAGHRGEEFSFDNEHPSHRHFLEPYALANRPITNGEWLEFMESGGYATSGLWLSDGWNWVTREGITAPLYWRREQDGWEKFSLSGWWPIDPASPVTHISFFEADAFATWAGARLPTEQEWEAVARDQNPREGIQLDRPGPVAPKAERATGGFRSLFGNVWEWTGSAYRPFPGFRAAPGAVGEYNGKFMSGQLVLKGGSCATPRGHVRASYRNFFYPHQRWQFTGLRLAKDL